RPVENAERRLPWRIVLGDLVGHRPVPAGHAARFADESADVQRPLALTLDGDDLVLPLPVPFDVVEVGEHVIRAPVDLDALADLAHSLPPPTTMPDGHRSPLSIAVCRRIRNCAASASRAMASETKLHLV